MSRHTFQQQNEKKKKTGEDKDEIRLWCNFSWFYFTKATKEFQWLYSGISSFCAVYLFWINIYMSNLLVAEDLKKE